MFNPLFTFELTTLQAWSLFDAAVEQNMVNEAVVVGYSTVSKRAITSAIASVGSMSLQIVVHSRLTVILADGIAG